MYFYAKNIPMKIFSRGIIHRFCTVLLLSLTAGSFMTACKNDSETVNADYSAVDDAAIQKYLAANAITTAQKQASGLYFVPVVTNATAAPATVGKNVSILYTGRLLDGTVFLSSAQNNNNLPTSFVLGNSQVIGGLQEGVSLMHLGDKATLLIPSALAFGPKGNPPSVPANAVVRFDVELVDLNYAITDEAIIKKYVADNSLTNAQRQSSGLYYVPVTANPTGVQATAGKTATVRYTGKLLNGTVFDPGTAPLNFVVGAKQVIPGFDEGISLMRTGEKAVLLIPSAQAYGPSSPSTTIPANSVLRFDVELVEVK
jgi:FKBP-type peptidyl-prolyl cis-trans isomerase